MNIDDDDQETGREAIDETVSHALSDEEARIWKREGFDELPLTMSVPVVGGYLGVSKSTAYNLCKAGTIRTRRFGERISVTRSELFRLLHGPDSPSAMA